MSFPARSTSTCTLAIAAGRATQPRSTLPRSAAIRAASAGDRHPAQTSPVTSPKLYPTAVLALVPSRSSTRSASSEPASNEVCSAAESANPGNTTVSAPVVPTDIAIPGPPAVIPRAAPPTCAALLVRVASPVCVARTIRAARRATAASPSGADAVTATRSSSPPPHDALRSAVPASCRARSRRSASPRSAALPATTSSVAATFAASTPQNANTSSCPARCLTRAGPVSRLTPLVACSLGLPTSN